MTSRIHQKLGTAGFVIAIVALVAALCGGAYAAKGALTHKQKKAVQKIAKKEAKKYAKKYAKQGKRGKTGAPGPAGPAGPAGPKGATGAAGTNGTNGGKGDKGDKGDRGDSGEGVNIVALAPNNGEECEAGGAKFFNGTGTAYACNGEGGSGGGGYQETLPSGQTETGLWDTGAIVLARFSGTEFRTAQISFPLPLAAAPERLTVETGSTPEELDKCPGSASEPKATPGVLCVYHEGGTAFSDSNVIGTTFPFGARMTLEQAEGSAKTFGSWAVTAP